jgi:hypothetical protein
MKCGAYDDYKGCSSFHQYLRFKEYYHSKLAHGETAKTETVIALRLLLYKTTSSKKLGSYAPNNLNKQALFCGTNRVVVDQDSPGLVNVELGSFSAIKQANGLKNSIHCCSISKSGSTKCNGQLAPQIIRIKLVH